MRRTRTNEALCLLKTPLVVAAILAALCPATTWGLINLYYTPVDLVRQSKVILRLQLGPADKDGRLPVRVAEVLQGENPKRMELIADTTSEKVISDLNRELGGAARSPGVLFVGDFSEAVDEGPGSGVAPVGALHVGTAWFALLPGGDGRLKVAEDKFQLHTVWAGSDAMLTEAVRYIVADPRADVPTKSGVRWGSDLLVGEMPGPVHGLMTVSPGGDGRPYLFVLCESADRLLRPAADGSSFKDVGFQLGLASRSRYAAWGDFNGDGYLDLGSVSGGKLSLHLTGGSEKLGAGAIGMELPKGCLGLAAMDTAAAARALLLVSAPRAPLIVRLGADGSLDSRPLDSAEGPLGHSGPCLPGDFDGDGLCDVVQPCHDGLLFYRGQSGGFSAASVACRYELGEGITAAIAGDYDADRLPDIVVGCAKGCSLFNNLGGGTFRETVNESGEVPYNAKPGVTGIVNFDINNDGRQEFVLLYGNMGPQAYFNRGFRCFGYAVNLQLKETDFRAAEPLTNCQLAGTAADFDGDGAEELLMASEGNRVWMLRRDDRTGWKLGVTVSLPRGIAGPVSVTAHDGKRCLGTRVVTATAPALFGKRSKGPMQIAWRFPGVAEKTRRLIVLRPTRFVLPPPGE